MPGDGQVPQLRVGQKFVSDLVPGSNVMTVEAVDGTETIIIAADGSLPNATYTNVTTSGTLTAEGAFTAEAAADFEGAVDLQSTVEFTGGILGLFRFGDAAAAFFGFGAAEESTIASGVLTVTKPFTIALPESSTADTIDSITYTGVAEGDFLLITSPATNTITVDDANINLGAATRAIAPGGALLLYFDGTQWTELIFIAATDNS